MIVDYSIKISLQRLILVTFGLINSQKSGLMNRIFVLGAVLNRHFRRPYFRLVNLENNHS